jgi:glycosyltransferase involved in cell wall biosynthesis
MTDLATGLAKRGLEIRVVAGRPSYWGTSIEEKDMESQEGIDITKVPCSRFDSKTRMGLLLNGFTFWILALLSCLSMDKERKLLLVTTPPFLPYLGLLLKKLRGQEYIPIIYDLYPEIGQVSGYLGDGPLVKIWGNTYRVLLREAQQIVVLGEAMRQKVRDKLPRDQAGKVRVIHNWEDGEFIKPLERELSEFRNRNYSEDSFIVLYSGNIAGHHGVEIIVQAAEYVTDPKVKFAFVGDGNQKARLKEIVEARQLHNVHFYPFQPREALPDLLASADLLTVTQQRGTEALCVSCKLYSAMAAGKPILAVAGARSEIAIVVNRHGCGRVVDSFEPGDIAQAIEEMAEDRTRCRQMGSRARMAFEQNYTTDHAIRKYASVLNHA